MELENKEVKEASKYTKTIKILGLNRDNNLEIWNGNYYLEFLDTEEGVDFLRTIGFNKEQIEGIYEVN